MEFLRNLLGIGGQRSSEDSSAVLVGPDAIWVHVRCNQCGEPIKVRLSKTSVLQRADPGSDYEWFVNKTIVGSRSRCFNRISLRLELDRRYRPVRTTLVGGTFISKAEYEQDEKM